MANNFLRTFMQQVGLDVDMFDQLGQQLLGGGQPAPATSNANQPQMGDPGTGQPMFPVNPGGAMMAPPPTGAPVNTWEPPGQVPMPYEGASSDRPTGITAQIYQGMLERGIPPHIADGFMMNFADESGFQLDIKEKGGGGRGLYQLTGPRREEFERLYGDDYSLDNQLDFLKYELEGPEAGAYAEIQKAQTPGEAAAAIVNHFERPAEEHRAAREAKYLGSEGSAWQSTMGGADDSIDYSALEEEVDEMTPKEQRRQARWAGLGAFSKGLGQMSRGQPIEVGDVFQDIEDRQKEARDRKMEIAKYRIQEQVEQRSHRWDLASDEADRQHDINLKQMDIDTAEADKSEINANSAAAIQTMYPDAPWIDTAVELANIDGGTAMTWAAEQEKKGIEAGEKNTLSNLYTEAGFDDIAQIAQVDPEQARDLYKERTGVSDAYLDAQVLARGGPEAIALATRLQLETLGNNPQGQAVVNNEGELLKGLAKTQLDNRARTSQMKLALSIAQDPTLDQGALTAKLKPIESYLVSLGKDPSKLSREELFHAVNESLIPMLRTPGDIMSDTDVTRYRDSTSQLKNTREGNVAILQAQIEADRRESAYINARTKYFGDPNNNPADGEARDAFIKQELEAQDATGDVFLNFGKDAGEDMPLRISRALERGTLTPGTAVYTTNEQGQTEIVLLDEEAIENIKREFGKAK